MGNLYLFEKNKFAFLKFIFESLLVRFI